MTEKLAVFTGKLADAGVLNEIGRAHVRTPVT